VRWSKLVDVLLLIAANPDRPASSPSLM
jgi:hypothetical protein